MIQVPGYRLLEELASGSSGTVYRAEQMALARHVALKLLAPGLFDAAETRARFLREAKLQAGLSHPHLLGVFDAGFAGDRPYLVMELVEGGTLRSRMRQRGAYPASEAVLTVSAIASGLAYAHKAGIVHRDLKPENVLVTRDGLFKIADFGLAKTLSSGRRTLETADGVILGTPGYMAPEVLAGEGAGPPADVYALGVILYELLAARRPFEAPGLAEQLRLQLEGAYEDPKGMPQSLTRLLQSTLSPKPGDRPAAGQLAIALSAADVLASAPESSGRSTIVAKLPQSRPANPKTRVMPATAERPPSGRSRAARGAALLLAMAGVVAGVWRSTAPVARPPSPVADLAASPLPAAPTRPRVVRVDCGWNRASVKLSAPAPAETKLLVLPWGLPAETRGFPTGKLEMTVTGLTPKKTYRASVQGGSGPGVEFTTYESPHQSTKSNNALALYGGNVVGAIGVSARDERVAVVWKVRETDRRNTDYIAESLDGGQTWTAPDRLAGPSNGLSQPVVALDETGTAAAWVSDADGLHFQFRPSGASEWSRTMKLPANGHDPGLVAVGPGLFEVIAFYLTEPPESDWRTRWFEIKSDGGLREGVSTFRCSHKHSRSCCFLVRNGPSRLVVGLESKRLETPFVRFVQAADPARGKWSVKGDILPAPGQDTEEFDIASDGSRVALGLSTNRGPRLYLAQDGGPLSPAALPAETLDVASDTRIAVAAAAGWIYVGMFRNILLDSDVAFTFWRTRDGASWDRVGKIDLYAPNVHMIRFAVGATHLVATVVAPPLGLSAATLPLPK